jgi:uncharacterized cofD-like protein
MSIVEHKRAATAVNVVALGGGHGLAATIRAIRHYAAVTTAIVATADDGGSSGRLRAAVDLPAPGDIRRCLVAMAGQSRWSDVVDYRFAGGDLDGHALGNLLLAGLTEVTGDFGEACDELARLLGLDTSFARVVPATVDPVVLRARAGHELVEGQVAITQTVGIQRVELVPADAASPKAAVEAILSADQVVLGPGSLFTSVLAAAGAPDLRAALHETSACRVYVCNLRAELGETRGYDVAAHVAALMRHDIPVDVVLHHDRGLPVGALRIRGVAASVARPNGLAHDPVLLSAALQSLDSRV